MNYNILPIKKNDNNSQFIDNKEMFNNRLFERNILNTEILNGQNVTPRYMSENYNINRKEANSIFNTRIIPELTKKPIVDFVNFRDNNINQIEKKNKKQITNYNSLQREANFFDNNKSDFKNTLLESLNKNPLRNSQSTRIPTNIDFSKSNLAFFIDRED